MADVSLMALASGEVLPASVAVLNLAVMIGREFWRGTDVLKALAPGAHSVFVERVALFGLSAAGEKRAAYGLTLLQKEIDINLALLVCPKTTLLSPDFICIRPP